MGGALRRSAFSPNIKERRDYSCAVFDAAGEVLAMGDHMPVHLGSMPRSVEAAVRAIDLGPGDIAVLNDPYAGGTHLPDITMVMPVFLRGVRGAVVLRGESRAPCGYRRSAGRLDGAFARDFPGGSADSAGEDFRCRPACRRRAENAARERAHATRTRGRPDRADRLLPHRRTPAGGNRGAIRPRGSGALQPLPAGVFGRNDALGAARHSRRDLSRRGLSRRRRHHRETDSHCRHDSRSRGARRSGFFRLRS